MTGNIIDRSIIYFENLFWIFFIGSFNRLFNSFPFSNCESNVSGIPISNGILIKRSSSIAIRNTYCGPRLSQITPAAYADPAESKSLARYQMLLGTLALVPKSVSNSKPKKGVLLNISLFFVRSYPTACQKVFRTPVALRQNR